MREQSKELELGDSEEEAKLQLDIFRRQYNTLIESHDQLIQKGGDLNNRITLLDQQLFGKEVGVGMRAKVDQMIVKVGERRRRMEERASPRLLLLQECLQFFVHDKTAEEVCTCVCVCACVCDMCS